MGVNKMLQFKRTNHMCSLFQNLYQNGIVRRDVKNLLWTTELPRCYSTSHGSKPNQAEKKGIIAKYFPARVYLEKDKMYAWCACGHSKKQPFCDGSHKTAATGMKSFRFKRDASGSCFLCLCKQTKKKPYCELSCIKSLIPERIRKTLNINL